MFKSSISWILNTVLDKYEKKKKKWEWKMPSLSDECIIMHGENVTNLNCDIINMPS